MAKQNSIEHINDAMNESVAEPSGVTSVADAMKALNINFQTAYIDAEPFIADPYSLLGQVIQIRKNNGVCPSALSQGGFPAELTAYPVPAKVKASSMLTKPQLRSSVIVNQTVAANVSLLNYLSAQLDANTTFSITVMDQAAGLLDTTDAAWRPALEQWKLDNQDLVNDPDICYLFVVGGFIQKNIIRKKYRKFDGKAKAGAFGVNIDGELSMSTEDYSLDIKFGLTPLVVKRPAAPAPQVVKGLAKSKSMTGSAPRAGIAATGEEIDLLNALGSLSIAKKKK